MSKLVTFSGTEQELNTKSLFLKAPNQESNTVLPLIRHEPPISKLNLVSSQINFNRNMKP